MYHGNPTAHEVFRQRRQLLVSFSAADINGEIAAFDIALLAQASLKCRQVTQVVRQAEPSNHWYCRLLRPYRHRQGRSGAAEEGEDGAAVHGRTHSITS